MKKLWKFKKDKMTKIEISNIKYTEQLLDYIIDYLPFKWINVNELKVLTPSGIILCNFKGTTVITGSGIKWVKKFQTRWL